MAQTNQAALTVAAVVERGAAAPAPQAEEEAARAAELKALIEPYRAQLDVDTKILAGTPFLEIIRDVLRNGRDLVIKCPEDPDWLERLFGSDDMHLLRKCPCPVWLVKPGTPKSYRRVAAAVDVADSYPPQEQKTRNALNRLVLDTAISIALSEFAELHVVYAWDAIGEQAMRYSAFAQRPEHEVTAYVEEVRRHQAGLLDALMHDVAAGLDRKAMDFLKLETHLVKGGPRKEIPPLVREIGADLLVMGTVARTGVAGLIMGNTAEAILTQIDCSVVAVKPPGFVTPVSDGG